MSRFGNWLRGISAATLTALGTSSAVAQQPPAPAYYYPELTASPAPGGLMQTSGFGRFRRADCPPPCVPGCVPGCPPGCAPGTVYPPGTVPETPVTPTPTPTPSEPVATDLGMFPDIGGRGRGAGAGPTVGLNGYIENAAPVTMFRLRFDAGYFANRPDRAEFFYAKCGCFRPLPVGDPLRDPNANGPPLSETSVDYQELTPYLEVALTERFSVFADIPIRFLNPTINANDTGLSDISFGFKYAAIYNDRRVVSFLLRSIAPSGRAGTGLGTGNWWIEPGVLWLEQMNPRWQVFGELRDRLFLDRQSDYTGNVLRYGLGTSYMVASGPRGYIAPVVEGVGWTVLSGKESTELGPVSSSGATIFNAKLGVRIGFGAVNAGEPYPTRSDLYVGYGRALTGEVWYKDLLRVEYRWFF